MAAPCVEHVAVRVRDFEAALAFFTDVMGMEITLTDPASGESPLNQAWVGGIQLQRDEAGSGDYSGGNKSPSKMLGLAHLNEGAETGDRVVVLDNVQDPGNVGTILRTALSFSYSSVVLLPHCASKFNEKVIQSSKGAIFRIPVFENVSLEELKERGLKIVSTSLQGAVDYRTATVREPFALVFGNEGQGISENTLQNSDLLIKIEMHNMDSLNVAVAAGILMNHYRK